MTEPTRPDPGEPSPPVDPTLELPAYGAGWTPPVSGPDYDRPYDLYRATGDFATQPYGQPTWHAPAATDPGAPAPAWWPSQTPSYGPPAPGAFAWPAPAPRRPVSHLTGALLATVFLCFPLGAVALFHALKVDPLHDRGDYLGARRASDRAGAWLVWAVAMGLAWIALVVLYFLIRR